jgi:hypothetical protein
MVAAAAADGRRVRAMVVSGDADAKSIVEEALSQAQLEVVTDVTGYDATYLAQLKNLADNPNSIVDLKAADLGKFSSVDYVVLANRRVGVKHLGNNGRQVTQRVNARILWVRNGVRVTECTTSGVYIDDGRFGGMVEAICAKLVEIGLPGTSRVATGG